VYTVQSTKFSVVCFETGMLFWLFRYMFETPNKQKNVFWFRETNKKQTKQIKFRFLSVQTENIFCLFRGDPTWGGGGDASIKTVMNIEKPCLVNLSLHISVCSMGGKLNRNLLTFI
jgi:hypothetical protein